MRVLQPIVCASLMIGLLCAAPSAAPQAANSAAVSVPRYVSFTGELKNQEGRPAGEIVDVTFLLYEEESGGEPLWTEHQRVTLDASSHFTVTLGSNTTGGMPIELFAAQKARWLAIEPEGRPMPDRVLLLSVPYAAKAGDAETLGGLPASAFLRSGATGGTVSPSPQPMAPVPVPNAPGGGGTTNYVPLWTPDGNTLGNSAIFQKGTGTSASIGINNTSPQAPLDVTGSAIVRGPLRLPNVSGATSGAGSASQQLAFTASSFSSSTQTPVAAKFVLQAVPQGNNTGAPGATLNLLYGTTAAAQTVLKIAGSGQITFAPGQTFPGIGTITGVTAGTGLSGGGTSGSPTLSLDTTYSDGRYARLAASNTFQGNNTYSGVQTFNNWVGIGVSPAYPLHVAGGIRSETGLSLGGNAALDVDAPGIIAGHFRVDSSGHVGINNADPQTALDVVGNIRASGSLSGSSLSVSGVVSSSSVSIGSDPVMTAAPRMYLSAFVPAPMSAGQWVMPIFTIPSKNIAITRVTIGGFNPCSQGGQQIFTLYSGPRSSLTTLNNVLVTSDVTNLISDSGTLSIPIAAGTPLWMFSNGAPNCGLSGGTVGNLAISVEYMMQ
jgi:hypothetical protein